jgi:hypothetical protein
MTIHQFLALFPSIKETKKGWDVCCPAHDDHSPSLGVMEGEEGRIVLNCFAGCPKESICAALGIQMSDLFADKNLNGYAEPRLLRPVKRSPRTLAFAFELHALDLQQQADKILAVAAPCDDCDSWTNDDRDLAMQAVSRAYAYRERAQFCESYADHLRERDYELKRLALREPSTGGASVGT